MKIEFALDKIHMTGHLRDENGDEKEPESIHVSIDTELVNRHIVLDVAEYRYIVEKAVINAVVKEVVASTLAEE